jgi:hypothetical protein
MIPVDERMMRLGTESAFDVLAKARALERQGRDIIHLEIGEPDFTTPPHIVAAAKKALDDGYTHSRSERQAFRSVRSAINALEVAGTSRDSGPSDQVVVTPAPAKPRHVLHHGRAHLRRAGPSDEAPDPRLMVNSNSCTASFSRSPASPPWRGTSGILPPWWRPSGGAATWWWLD